MSEMKSSVRLIDTTLRDGSHAVFHKYTAQNITDICAGLEKGGVYAAEVGHGAGLGGSILEYGFATESDRTMMQSARKVLKNTKLAALLVPGLGTMDDLRMAAGEGLDIVRVALHCTEVTAGEQHIMLGKKLGLTTVCFFMMCHMTSPEALAEQAKMASEYGADIIYIADSSGALTPQGMRDRVHAIQAVVDLPIGVHTHNNLGLGVGNAITAVECGAAYCDGSLEGQGAGCGNGNIQAIAAVLDKMGVKTGADIYALMDVAEQSVRPTIHHSLEITNESITLGYNGIYSSFYQHTKEASERYGIPAREIFTELGKRKVIGGQEDQIIDICYEVLDKRKAEAKK